MTDQRDLVTAANLEQIQDPLWVATFGKGIELLENGSIPQAQINLFAVAGIAKKQEIIAEIRQIFGRFDIYEKGIP